MLQSLSKQKMKLKDLISNSKIPILEAELITAHLLDLPREKIITSPDLVIESQIVKKFKKLQNKRLKNYPLAYLLETKDFYSLSFKVNKHVLVPRPETERMIDYVLDYIKTNNNVKRFNFLDIGTGSGAIIISIAKSLKKDHEACFKLSHFLATDISRKALEVAKENIANHGFKSKIKTIKSDLLEKIPDNFLKLTNNPLIICANLPYLSHQEWRQEPSISREPKLALHSPNKGLKHYRRLFKQIELKAVSNFLLICEINPQQEKDIKKITDLILINTKYYSFSLEDYSRRTRFFVVNVK